jgi:hypothetical protein
MNRVPVMADQLHIRSSQSRRHITPRQKRLYDDFAARIAEDSLGTDWAAFRRNLVTAR